MISDPSGSSFVSLLMLRIFYKKCVLLQIAVVKFAI
uniref:Uncharacterized protein n=1 Tax=Anguilla anguilla TaxID=7936 RepID=A0A0E9SL35_ANGAN